MIALAQQAHHLQNGCSMMILTTQMILDLDRLVELLGMGTVGIQSRRFRMAEWAGFDDERGSIFPKRFEDKKAFSAAKKIFSYGIDRLSWRCVSILVNDEESFRNIFTVRS